jgi:hypothetical protein
LRTQFAVAHTDLVWTIAAIDICLSNLGICPTRLSTSLNRFNSLRWAAEIDRIGEPSVLDARKGSRLVMNCRSDGSKSKQSYQFHTSNQRIFHFRCFVQAGIASRHFQFTESFCDLQPERLYCVWEAGIFSREG